MGITVVGESQGGYNDLYQKIIAGIPANQLPTMSVAYQNQAATYAVQGVLVNLDPWKVRSGATRRKSWTTSSRSRWQRTTLPQFDGLWLASYKSMEVMYYNQDWLEELGYDGPPETWEELEEMARGIGEPILGSDGRG